MKYQFESETFRCTFISAYLINIFLISYFSFAKGAIGGLPFAFKQKKEKLYPKTDRENRHSGGNGNGNLHEKWWRKGELEKCKRKKVKPLWARTCEERVQESFSSWP